MVASRVTGEPNIRARLMGAQAFMAVIHGAELDTPGTGSQFAIVAVAFIADGHRAIASQLVSLVLRLVRRQDDDKGATA